MKPLKIQSVRKSYRPGYPRFVEVDNWRELVRPANQKIFAPSTLLFAGLLGGSLFTAATAGEPPKPQGRKLLKASNTEAANIANAALNEVQETRSFHEGVKQVRTSVAGSNPKVTSPEIRISFGNSYVGVFDLVRAKKTTVEIFSAYGIQLKENYRIDQDGMEFEADGYDPQKGIGYEIIGSERPPTGFDQPPVKGEKAPAKVLDEKEAETLRKTVGDGKMTMFLVPVENYPNMDGDQYTPLRAYLKSVLDYLDWLKKEGKI